jgi:capsular polysaccharide biosynthesis protein
VGLVPQEARIVIQVDDLDPQQAAHLANELAGRLETWVAEEFKATQADEDPITVRTLVPAEVPTAPYSPRYQLNTVAGAVLGALVSLPLAFLWDALRREKQEARSRGQEARGRKQEAGGKETDH